MVALLLISLVYVLRERGALRFADLRSLPFLIPSGIFVVTLLLNGAFAPGYTASNLLLALIEGVALTLLIYVFILGFRGERSEELIGYFIYISAVVALLIFVETAILYFSGDVLVSGSAVKDNIFYGWGVANTAGQALTATLPVLFLGAMRSNREAVLCLSAAFLALVTVLLTLSRSALLVAGVIVLLSLVIGCFFGNTKRIFRIFLPALFVVGTLLSVAVWEKASTLVADIFKKGFSDNGRYALWGTGIDEFLKYPIFGRGFYGFEELLSEPLYLYIGFFPRMLHNTVLELLAATGVCGFVGYAVYRFYTARFFFKRPSLAKTMLGLAVLTLLLQSLLDNFLFYVQPTFYYSIAIAITVLLDEQRKTVIK
jgi:O-antigen ligase